jgi:hypothetical protein
MESYHAASERHDPEQAGILLDRLACEIARAVLKNPQALPELRRDAQELLFCLDPLLTAEVGATAMAVHTAAWGEDASALAHTLEELACFLLDRAERELTDAKATGGA